MKLLFILFLALRELSSSSSSEETTQSPPLPHPFIVEGTALRNPRYSRIRKNRNKPKPVKPNGRSIIPEVIAIVPPAPNSVSRRRFPWIRAAIRTALLAVLATLVLAYMHQKGTLFDLNNVLGSLLMDAGKHAHSLSDWAISNGGSRQVADSIGWAGEEAAFRILTIIQTILDAIADPKTTYTTAINVLQKIPWDRKVILEFFTKTFLSYFKL